MKSLILMLLFLCSTLCYAQADDPFGLYENSSSYSNTQKETNYRYKELISKISFLEKENKEKISEISFLEKENNELISKISFLEKKNNELLDKITRLETKLNATSDDRWEKVNKQLLEQIKGLQIELSELKNSQKEWK